MVQVSQTVIVVGLGEVGKPLFEIIRMRHQAFGIDIDLAAPLNRCDVMHICFPFSGRKFIGQVVDYIRRYQPALTIINSTVAPGATRRIADGDVWRACTGAVALGGDTDTIAAMAGAMVGACTGLARLPSDAVRKVREVNLIDLEPIARGLLDLRER